MAERFTVDSIFTGVGEVDKETFDRSRAAIAAYARGETQTIPPDLDFLMVEKPLYGTGVRVPSEFVHEWENIDFKEYMRQLRRK